MLVVVVLPWVPPIATDHFRRISSRQHLGAADDRDQGLTGGDDFRIVLLHGGRDHDDRGVGEVFAAMADLDRNAECAQALDVGAVGDVGAAHGVAEVPQDLGDAAHADPADTDEVDRPDGQGQGSHYSAASVE